MCLGALSSDVTDSSVQNEALRDVGLRWVEEGIALVTDPDLLFLAALYRHLTLRARLTDQAATSPAVMSSVKLQTRTNVVFTSLTRTKDKTEDFEKDI